MSRERLCFEESGVTIPEVDSPLPRMHCHDELLEDLAYTDHLPDTVLRRWFESPYSTSKHLLTLYSLSRGLAAKTIVEIGFGRSSFVLARAARENDGRLISCDVRDFSYLLSPAEREVAHFVHGRSDALWRIVEEAGRGIDFIFMDYFSIEALGESYIEQEIRNALCLMKRNAMLAVHDAFDSRYQVAPVLAAFAQEDGCEAIVLPYNHGLGLLRRTSDSAYGELPDAFPKGRRGQ